MSAAPDAAAAARPAPRPLVWCQRCAHVRPMTRVSGRCTHPLVAAAMARLGERDRTSTAPAALLGILTGDWVDLDGPTVCPAFAAAAPAEAAA